MTALSCGWVGCSPARDRQELERLPVFPPGTVIAVAPALNFSGSTAFDPVIVGDLMASELADVPGMGVIGVNRVLALLAEQGVARIQSPRQAIEICGRLGADALLVFAVTEYDPYTPIVGITAQLYGPPPLPAGGAELAAGAPHAPAQPARPLAQAQRIFNADHQRVQHYVREYADKRDAGESPYGWRKYVASQELFLRFCCWCVARELTEQQPLALFGPGPTGGEEE
jgi:hypothetical protein